LPQIDWLPFITFFLSATLSPGPNNISSASSGILHGVRRTIPFILGITVGIFTYMVLSGWLSGALLETVPQFEKYMRILGGTYILWLAYKTLRATYQIDAKEKPPLRFLDGLLLQFVNPKVLFFGLMVFTGFLQPYARQFIFLIPAAFLLACWIFLVNFTYAGAGSAIRKYIENKNVIRAFNIVMALMLVYSALEMIGVLDWLLG
jgi:cysteine/O-acetylserine efflux protein